ISQADGGHGSAVIALPHLVFRANRKTRSLYINGVIRTNITVGVYIHFGNSQIDFNRQASQSTRYIKAIALLVVAKRECSIRVYATDAAQIIITALHAPFAFGGDLRGGVERQTDSPADI